MFSEYRVNGTKVSVDSVSSSVHLVVLRCAAVRSRTVVHNSGVSQCELPWLSSAHVSRVKMYKLPSLIPTEESVGYILKTSQLLI
jgi:hypothetical protein